MFERFTEATRSVIVEAQDEARRLRHTYIGTEHLVLGLLAGDATTASRVLRMWDITSAGVREAVEDIVGVGNSEPSGQVPLTPRAKDVVELAFQEALAMGCVHIGTEHLLLGLLDEGEGIGARILDDFDVTAEEVRTAVARELDLKHLPPPARLSERHKRRTRRIRRASWLPTHWRRQVGWTNYETGDPRPLRRLDTILVVQALILGLLVYLALRA